MRALNIVVKRTSPRWRRRGHVPLSGWSSQTQPLCSQRVHFIGRLQRRHNALQIFPDAAGSKRPIDRFRARAPFRAFYPCQGQKMFQPRRGHSSF
jgi:hypothetical protein